MNEANEKAVFVMDNALAARWVKAIESTAERAVSDASVYFELCKDTHAMYPDDGAKAQEFIEEYFNERRSKKDRSTYVVLSVWKGRCVKALKALRAGSRCQSLNALVKAYDDAHQSKKPTGESKLESAIKTLLDEGLNAEEIKGLCAVKIANAMAA